jgi:O-acetyl-ADP-ribose deacetylase (regulator of RNase III)
MGGDSIQQECQSKYPDGINPGEIAVTGGGNLGCKIVCHGALPAWDKKGQSKVGLSVVSAVCSELSLFIEICYEFILYSFVQSVYHAFHWERDLVMGPFGSG